MSPNSKSSGVDPEQLTPVVVEPFHCRCWHDWGQPCCNCADDSDGEGDDMWCLGAQTNVCPRVVITSTTYEVQRTTDYWHTYNVLSVHNDEASARRDPWATEPQLIPGFRRIAKVTKRIEVLP